MTEEQILDFLEAGFSDEFDNKLKFLRKKHNVDILDAEAYKCYLQNVADHALILRDVLKYIKSKKAKLQNTSELADVSDETLVEEIKDRGLEKYL